MSEHISKHGWRRIVIAALGLVITFVGVFLFIFYIGNTRRHRNAVPACSEYEDVCSDACRTENFGGNCMECCTHAKVECSEGRDFEQVLKECRAQRIR